MTMPAETNAHRNKKKEIRGTLNIDSTSFDEVKFAFVPLDDGHQLTVKSYALTKRNTQTASYLKKFIAFAIKGDTSRIIALAVKVGEGSFAGIRTGISLALGMGFALDIPVYSFDAKRNSKLITSATEIDYGAAPNIGVAKKKILKQIS